MTKKYFGTDGIRGEVGISPIVPDFMLRLGYAAGKVLIRHAKSNERQRVLIGKDTRISGYLLEAALESGFSAAGVDVTLCGPMPTPGVAYLTKALRLSAGVVISASHNLYQDNGIKFLRLKAISSQMPLNARLSKSLRTRWAVSAPTNWVKLIVWMMQQDVILSFVNPHSQLISISKA